MMIRNYKPSDLQTLRQITVTCFEKVSIDKTEDMMNRTTTNKDKQLARLYWVLANAVAQTVSLWRIK